MRTSPHSPGFDEEPPDVFLTDIACTHRTTVAAQRRRSTSEQLLDIAAITQRVYAIKPWLAYPQGVEIDDQISRDVCDPG